MDFSRPSFSPWRWLTLVASLLTCGICQASGQIFISPDSLLGVEKYRTILTLENVPEDVLEYSWYRGKDNSTENMIFSYKPPNTRHPGPSYSGRENVTRAGSLVVRMSAVNDTGYYTVEVDTSNETQRATGWLQIVNGPDYVSLWTQPYFFAGVLTADIGSSVQLECNCFSKPEPRYHWIHNGSFLSIPENNMTLPSLSWEQMGSYRCVVENPETQLTFYRDVTIQPPRPPLPTVNRELYIPGPLVIFLILLTSLGGAFVCRVLVYSLFQSCSRGKTCHKCPWQTN
ncbi:carcinoembryonic antigen-related cell adhesion molecule 18 isoform 2 precursor [Mus musculus]|uniref:cell adhesion molecule CEACAM18 isoform 2 precursor n=1 Tax=Mus musculus TaxID=10090 RepID=UPI0003D6F169|nr:carcinoembryonic antigen-related cell adhesion molecule 18 isoform 2 precursor [Mus musculus]